MTDTSDTVTKKPCEPIDLDKWLIPYARLQVFYGEDDPRNSILHIRAIVDDEWVVYRTWLMAQQQWKYVMNRRSLFEQVNQNGYLRRA